jgi:hypothetical protein
MIPLFKLQNHCSTRVVQLLVQVFHLVFHLHLWCSTLHPARPASGTASPSARPSAVSASVILCDVLLAV